MNIPGYYYDEEKKKYFKIQANHQAPQGAKYSRESVKQDERRTKKRKIEEKKSAVRHSQTIKRNPTLQHVLLGRTGLLREHGTDSSSSLRVETGHAALVSQWSPSRTAIKFPGWKICSAINLQCAKYLPATQQMITASTHGHTGVSAVHVFSGPADASEIEIPDGCGVAAFSSAVSSISTTTMNNVPRMIVCSPQNAQRLGDVYMGLLPALQQETATNDYQPPGIYLNLGSQRHTSPFASTIHHSTGMAAILAKGAVYVIDQNADISNSLDRRGNAEFDYAPGIDWLDANTLAFNARPLGVGNHRVMLWDTRTEQGTSMRFSLPNRITGIANPSNGHSASHSNHQLLVSSNFRINLFETRMPRSEFKHDTPILSVPHVHKGPELEFTTNNMGLVAAVDLDNLTQVYSTRSGYCIGSLTPPKTSETRGGSWISSMVKDLMWYDDPSAGSNLQACLGNGVITWT